MTSALSLGIGGQPAGGIGGLAARSRADHHRSLQFRGRRGADDEQKKSSQESEAYRIVEPPPILRLDLHRFETRRFECLIQSPDPRGSSGGRIRRSRGH